VRVNCVCPAAVDTPLLAEVAPRIPPDGDPRLLDRMQMLLPAGVIAPAAVAAAVAYLASDEAGALTGVALPLDGGISA
ncbi:MAG TPA: SDR family oxidoreductase, partial [Acidimicrobiales bacterium]|nr:SDR family oxidoreductase [Acidimicrobiales bacterium]